MSPRDLIGEAAMALRVHPLRTVLAATGITCGIATVVTALAIVEGAREAAVAEISALGVDNVIVRAADPLPPGGAKPPAPILTVADADALERGVPGTRAVAASRAARLEMDADGRHAEVTLLGVTRAWRDISGIEVATGRWLSDVDAQSRARVTVLGAGIARELFAGASPLGAQVRAGGAWYVVVGTLVDRAIEGRAGSSQVLEIDRTAIVPLAAMDVKLGDGDTVDRVQEVIVQVGNAAAVERAADAAATIVERRHGAPPRYAIVVPRELLRARLRAQRTFNTVLIAIGLLALTISGVGIMNVMLASVAERRHEIGVRRALGARRSDIAAQFAIEAAALSVAGGAVGVALGAVFARVIALFAQWPVSLSVTGIAMALALSLTVGLGFGIIPARGAAAVEPMEALRAA